MPASSVGPCAASRHGLFAAGIAGSLSSVSASPASTSGWVMVDPKGCVQWSAGVWGREWQAWMSVGLRNGVTREDLFEDGWSAVAMHVVGRPA